SPGQPADGGADPLYRRAGWQHRHAGGRAVPCALAASARPPGRNAPERYPVRHAALPLSHTTDRDRAMADWLAPLAKVDINAYGTELMGAAPGLTARTAEEIVDGDRKSYQFDGLTLSIGQVEVNSLQELPQRRAELLEALDQRLHSEGLGLICLMITDVVAERSVLLCRGDGRLLAALPFRRTGEYEFNLGDMVSRKKQLVPALHAALEEAR